MTTAEQILTAVGGPDNVASLTRCWARLRFELHDAAVVDEAAIGALPVGSCLPCASNQPICPRRATSDTTPGVVPLSISRWKASRIRCRRSGERPMVSGFADGRAGVALAALGVVWTFMLPPAFSCFA